MSKKSVVNIYLRSTIIVIFLIIFLAITLIFLNGQKRITKQSEFFLQEYTDFKKTAIKDEINIVLSFIKEKIVQTKNSDEAERNLVKQEVLQWVNSIRLRANQYIVVNTMDGVILAHFNTANIGKNMWDYRDANGVKAIQEAIQVSQKKEGGFVRYVGSIRPVTRKPGRKISYAKSVPEWGWVVSTGVYLDDLEEVVRGKNSELVKNLQGDFVNIAVVLAGVLFFFAVMAKFFSVKMRNDFASLTQFFKTAANKNNSIDPQIFSFREFQNLTHPVNQMIATISSTQKQLEQQQLLLEEKVRLRTDELKGEVEKQKQIQEELRESEATLISVFRAAPVGIGMVKDRIIVQVNSRFCEMVGYDDKEVIGQSSRILYQTDEEFELVGKEKYKQMREKGMGTVETRWQQKEGGVIDVLLTSTPLNMDDWSLGVTYTALDITESKLFVEALRKSEEKFRNIFESLMDVYFETTPNGIIKNVSPSAKFISGYAVSELIGKRVNFLFSNPADRKLFADEIEFRGFVRGFELLFEKKNGELCEVSINADKLFDRTGNPVGLYGTIRDVTRQKKLEETLQRSKKMESLGLMAGGIAHDLNNILSGIVTYPDLLLLDIPEDSPLRRPLEAIRNSGIRASDVVSDLLTIARGVVARKDVVSLNSIVREYVDSAEYGQLSRIHSTVEFGLELDKELLNIYCSSPHLKKVLMNVVSNAAEAIEGKGQVLITTTNKYLDKPLRGYEDVEIGEYVLLRISDSGKGIPRGDLSQIFEPFFTRKKMGRSGTGLGLTVVWNTVQDHDGYMNVDSSGEGTVFELYFPVTRQQVKGEETQVSKEDYLGNGQRILVVDDEEHQREVTRELIKKLNYSVTTVSSGEDAIEYLREQRVDLLILDMIMEPGMNGRETFEKIKENTPEQKAIIASGYAETAEVRATQMLGAGEYIKKPYTLERLGLAIKAELNK